MQSPFRPGFESFMIDLLVPFLQYPLNLCLCFAIAGKVKSENRRVKRMVYFLILGSLFGKNSLTIIVQTSHKIGVFQYFGIKHDQYLLKFHNNKQVLLNFCNHLHDITQSRLKMYRDNIK